MDIDRYFHISRANRTDLHAAQEVVAALRGIPFEIFERFPVALDTDDVEADDIETVAKMMCADGFPEWGEWWLNHENRHGAHWLAADWSKLKALRTIIERDENTLLVHDRAFLTVNFGTLQKMLSQLDDVRIAWLSWWFNRSHPIDLEVRDQMYKTHVPGILDGFALAGLEAVFFTPAGAAHFLNIWREMPWSAGEGVAFKSRDTHDHSGFYAFSPHAIEYLGKRQGGKYSVGKRDKVRPLSLELKKIERRKEREANL